MFQHDAKGATGLVVNRPVAEVALADFLARFGVGSQGVSGRILVHYGGPVEPSRAFAEACDPVGQSAVSAATA